MRKILTIIFISIYSQAFCQTTFEKKWGGSGYQDGMTICKTSDGGFAIAGVSSTDTSTQLDIAILRTDSLGDSLWTKSLGGSSANDFPSKIIQTYDGGFLISSTTYSYSSQAPNFSDWWIIRMNANGDTMWTKIIRKIGNDRMWYISENDDHSFICCGWLSIGGYAKGTLMKFSETGDSLWSVQIGSSGNSYAQFCRQNYNGNYLVAGGALSGTFQGVVHEYDTAGIFIAGHSYDKTVTAEIINTIDHLPQGGFLISAKTGTINGYDIWIIRTNDLWDTLWTKTFNDPIYLYDTEARFAFDITADTGCIFGGMQFGTSDMQAVLYRIDSTGILEWSRNFGNVGDDRADDLISLDDGGFVFSGYTGLVTNISADIYIVRTDANGNISGINITDEKLSQGQFQLFPNPADGILHWKSESNSISEIKIYSSVGILIQTLISPSSNGNINLDYLSAGMYLVEISTAKESFVKKLLIN